MDSKSLSFAVALVGTAIALLTIIFALYRRERGLSIFALSFVCAIAGFVLFTGQGSVSAWISYIWANLLLLLYQLGLAWGLRVCFGLRPQLPRRFAFYLVVWLAILLAGVWVWNSYTIRAASASVFIIIAALEFLLVVFRNPQTLPPLIRRATHAIVIGFVFFHLFRLALILIGANHGMNLMDNQFLNSYTFSFTIFFSVLWAGIILIIDAAILFSELEKKNSMLKSLAMTDELTGLSNRHLFDSCIVLEMERAARYREPLSAIMLDLDHFKRVNDVWGHHVGDTILKGTAALVQSQIRDLDLLFRWGGEEFVVLLPHTALPGAISLAEKLRSVLASNSYPEVGTVTASFGAAEWRPQDSLDQWFKQVDQALYRAKNTGRNRVIGFGSQDNLPTAFIKIEWRTSWESGSELVDEQHRILLDMSNNLLDLSLSQGNSAEIKSCLDALLAHVAKHFDDEEQVLSVVGYPDLPAHAQLHRDLLKEALDLKTRFAEGRCEPNTLFNYLVGRVVTEHLMQADVRFFSYMKAYFAS